MTRDQDGRAFVQHMKRLTVLGRETTPFMLKVFWEHLCGLELAEFTTAVERCLAQDTFFPAPARLLELARAQHGLVRARGAGLFERLMKRAPQYSPARGSYWRTIDVEQALGLAAREAFLAAGGSHAFSDATDRDMPFLRKAFLDAYELAVPAERQGLIEPTPVPLAGPVQAILGDLTKSMSFPEPPRRRQLAPPPVPRRIGQEVD